MEWKSNNETLTTTSRFFEDYEIETNHQALLGVGGFGVVFKCRHKLSSWLSPHWIVLII
jgi:hypothetical protein